MADTATSVHAEYQRPPNLLYALDERPPWVRLVLLGLQFAIVDAIYLVLAAIILRSANLPQDQQVALLGIGCVALAIGTALQALPKGPIGSGFLAPPVFSATYLAPSVLAAKAGGMELVFGMTIFAGVVEVCLGLALTRLRMIITPILSGLAVFVVGLQLGVLGIGQMLDVRHAQLPNYHYHLLVTTLTLATCIGLSIWGRGVAKLLSTMIGLIIGLSAAVMAVMTSSSAQETLAAAAWLALPMPAMMGLTFDVYLVPAFLAAAVAAGLRAVGVITTCQRINNAAWRHPDTENVRKGVLADGLANIVGGILGGVGMSVSPTLVGISAATGATSRAIAFAAAAVLFVIGCSPKLVGVFMLVPPEVAGSLLVFTACFMIVGGMTIILSRTTDLRGNFIIGISTLLALSETAFPEYFQHLSPAVRTITSSPLSLGLAVALVLTLLFQLGIRQLAKIEWSGTDESTAAALAFLRATQKTWNIASRTVESSVADIGNVLAYIVSARAHSADGIVAIVYNGIEIVVDVRSRSNASVQLPSRIVPAAPVEGELDNEESVAYVGLQHFIKGLTADRKEIHRDGDTVIARLYYTL